jgi:hypothetical protein
MRRVMFPFALGVMGWWVFSVVVVNITGLPLAVTGAVHAWTSWQGTQCYRYVSASCWELRGALQYADVGLLVALLCTFRRHQAEPGDGRSVHEALTDFAGRARRIRYRIHFALMTVLAAVLGLVMLALAFFAARWSLRLFESHNILMGFLAAAIAWACFFGKDNSVGNYTDPYITPGFWVCFKAVFRLYPRAKGPPVQGKPPR